MQFRGFSNPPQSPSSNAVVPKIPIKKNQNQKRETGRQPRSSEGAVRARQARKCDWKKPIRSGEILPRWKQRLNKLYFCVSAARGTSAKRSVKVPFVLPPIHCLPVRAKRGKSWQTIRTGWRGKSGSWAFPRNTVFLSSIVGTWLMLLLHATLSRKKFYCWSLMNSRGLETVSDRLPVIFSKILTQTADPLLCLQTWDVAIVIVGIVIYLAIRYDI